MSDRRGRKYRIKTEGVGEEDIEVRPVEDRGGEETRSAEGGVDRSNSI